MLVNILGTESAIVCVIRLWSHCQSRRQWQFESLPSEAIKAVCRFDGDSSTFESALITSGFIKRDGNALIVCNWEEYNASLIANWNNGKRGGRPKKKTPEQTNGKPTGYERVNPPETRQEPIRLDRIGIDKIREENTKEVEEEGNGVEISEQKSIAEHQEYLAAIGAEAVFKTGPSPECREWWDSFPKSTKLDACSKVYSSTLSQVAIQFNIKIEDAHERLKAITRRYADSPQGKSERWCCSALNFLVEGRWREDPSKWQLRENAIGAKTKTASETSDAAFEIYQRKKESELANARK